MRVIAGSLRSRRLATPAGMATRPSSDRLRETLFNVLAPRLEGCRFADLYAGSGAVGIEALSRGAASAWFVEDAPLALRALRQNLAELRLTSFAQVEERRVDTALRAVLRRGAASRFDVVFLDPPYAEAGAYAGTLGLLGGEGAELLANDSVVVAEHSSKVPPAEAFGRLELRRRLKQGDATLSFYGLAGVAQRPEEGADNGDRVQ